MQEYTALVIGKNHNGINCNAIVMWNWLKFKKKQFCIWRASAGFIIRYLRNVSLAFVINYSNQKYKIASDE